MNIQENIIKTVFIGNNYFDRTFKAIALQNKIKTLENVYPKLQKKVKNKA